MQFFLENSKSKTVILQKLNVFPTFIHGIVYNRKTKKTSVAYVKKYKIQQKIQRPTDLRKQYVDYKDFHNVTTCHRWSLHLQPDYISLQRINGTKRIAPRFHLSYRNSQGTSKYVRKRQWHIIFCASRYRNFIKVVENIEREEKYIKVALLNFKEREVAVKLFYV